MAAHPVRTGTRSRAGDGAWNRSPFVAGDGFFPPLLSPAAGGGFLPRLVSPAGGGGRRRRPGVDLNPAIWGEGCRVCPTPFGGWIVGVRAIPALRPGLTLDPVPGSPAPRTLPWERRTLSGALRSCSAGVSPAFLSSRGYSGHSGRGGPCSAGVSPVLLSSRRRSRSGVGPAPSPVIRTGTRSRAGDGAWNMSPFVAGGG